jgi:hypothetical protein
MLKFPCFLCLYCVQEFEFPFYAKVFPSIYASTLDLI